MESDIPPIKNRKRRSVLILTGVVGVALTALAYSYFIEPQRLVINSAELKISKWNPAFDGIKIIAISDIHGGSNSVDEAKIRRVVDAANAQDPDLVVLLGDYVSQTGPRRSDGKRALRMPVDTIAASLKGLHAKLGVFAVLGNHDGWHDDGAIAEALNANGIKVLDGEVAVVEKNGALLRILGLKDQLKIKAWEDFHEDARKLLAATEGAGDILVLEHSPDVAPIINGPEPISKDMRLMIAAHTHGGQVWLPVLGRPIVPSGYGQKYAAGHVRDNGLDIFVTTGVGTSILPFRFMVPPEIAVLTVRSAE
ncbi:MAG: metallophosphoesterase [Pyrinomonadaceae bacterium]